MKILIREANWLGDAVMSIPLLTSVHDRYPDAQMSIAAKESLLPLFDLLGWEVKKIPLAGMTTWLRLRKEKFDFSIILPNSFRSSLEVFLTGARMRIGYAVRGRGIFLTERVSLPAAQNSGCGYSAYHQADYYFNLLAPCGIKGTRPPAKLIVKDKDREAMAGLLADTGIDLNKPVIAVSPGARYGEAKCWPEENFVELLKKLKGIAQIIFVGIKNESPLIERIISRAGDNSGINLAGKTTLLELAGLFSISKLIISNDTGAMHLASILGVPVIAIFGPTDPLRTGPLGEGAIIVHEKTDCSPCNKRICRDKKCFSRIQAERIRELVLNFI